MKKNYPDIRTGYKANYNGYQVKRLEKVSKVLAVNSPSPEKGKNEEANTSRSFCKSPYVSTNKVLPKVKLEKIPSFQKRFEQKVESLRNTTKSAVIYGCLEMLDMIIKEDFLFSKYLIRVKAELLGYMKFVESQIKGGKSVDNIRSYMITNREGLIKRAEEKNSFLKLGVIKEHDFFIQSPLKSYRTTEKDANGYGETISNNGGEKKKEIVSVNFVQGLQNEIERLKEKEFKWQVLIETMKNRGFPVDELLRNDVMLTVKSLENKEIQRYFTTDQVELSSDVSEEHE